MKKQKLVATTEVVGNTVLKKSRFKFKKDWENRQARKKMQKKSRKQNRPTQQ